EEEPLIEHAAEARVEMTRARRQLEVAQVAGAVDANDSDTNRIDGAETRIGVIDDHAGLATHIAQNVEHVSLRTIGAKKRIRGVLGTAAAVVVSAQEQSVTLPPVHHRDQAAVVQ